MLENLAQNLARYIYKILMITTWELLQHILQSITKDLFMHGLGIQSTDITVYIQFTYTEKQTMADLMCLYLFGFQAFLYS